MFGTKKPTSRRIVVALFFSAFASIVSAQSAVWPSKPVTLVVGFAPGGQQTFWPVRLDKNCLQSWVNLW